MLGSQFPKFQSQLAWPYSPGPVLRHYIIAESTVEQSCSSPDDCKEKDLEQDTDPKSMSPVTTFSKLGFPSESFCHLSMMSWD